MYAKISNLDVQEEWKGKLTTMKYSRPSLDNLTDILHVIIRFTQSRRSILANNIQQAQSGDFVPMDLAADEFSIVVNEALSEHLQCGRLLWRDTPSIRFGASGMASFRPRPDLHAKRLRITDTEGYLDHESRLLLENEINRKVAKGLLTRCWENATSSLTQPQ